MKLTEYIQDLQQIESKHGGDLEVIYATDDEGNGFNTVVFTPTACNWDGEETGNGEDINAVCIN
jgi:hypothetical protein